MKLVTLACNECGAKLKASRTTKFVTCTHCDADLAVHFEDGAAFTEVRRAVRDLEEATDELKEEVAELRREQGADRERARAEVELQRIERAWEAEKDGLMPKGKRGQRYVPTAAQGWASVAAGGGFVVFGIIFFAAAPKGTSIGVFGLAMTIVSACAAVVMGFVRMAEAKRFHAARTRYEEQVAEARARLRALPEARVGGDDG